MTSSLRALMHPRCDSRAPWEGINVPWPAERRRRAMQLLEFIRTKGEVHPRQVDTHFAHGKVRNYWGGSSNATTQLLDGMHYRGMLRVARRESGIRIYAPHEHPPQPDDPDDCRARLDRLVDIVVNIYAPLTEPGLRFFVRHLRFAVPQWQTEITEALKRAKERLAHARIGRADWYWPAQEDPSHHEVDNTVRLLAPFDPLVRDRERFETLWGWVYRFEAYTPASKRVRGYYALPLLWRDRVIGWGNISVANGKLHAEIGYVNNPPRGRDFKRELNRELDKISEFLRLKRSVTGNLAAKAPGVARQSLVAMPKDALL